MGKWVKGWLIRERKVAHEFGEEVLFLRSVKVTQIPSLDGINNFLFPMLQ